MSVPAEFASVFATFPDELRKLVEAELTAGNAVVAVENGFPAAPCGASIKLAQAVASERRKTAGGVHFHARNNTSYAGEFTTEPRHFFVLEPPLPPEPDPDMNAIREAAEGTPDALTLFARTRAPGIASPAGAAALRGPDAEPARASGRALRCTQTATGARRILHFRDPRPPHEILFALERDLMTPFAAAMKDGRLSFTAKASVIGAQYDFELRFEAARPLECCYSLRVEASWAAQAATHHDYYRKTAQSWFGFWTRDFIPVNPPSAHAGSSTRYEAICAASLNAEAHLATVAALQQSIVAAMKRGARFITSHKEGGTRLSWSGGHFVRSDYGDYPAYQVYADEAEFLRSLRQFYDRETSRNNPAGKVSDFQAWKLILRLLRGQ